MAILTSKRTETEIVRDGLDRLDENVGINATTTTSTARNLLEIMAVEHSNMWDTMTDLLNRNFLTTAYGESLDKIGELLQEPRKNAQRAMDLSTSNLYFQLDKTYAANITDLLVRYYTTNDLEEMVTLGLIDSSTNPGQLNIPAGVFVLSADQSASFSTTRDIALTNAQDIDYSPIVANGVGSAFNVGPNTLVKHNLVALYPILRKVANGILVSNRFGIRNGEATESDENYRFRLANKVVSATAGNESAIRKAVLSIPGVVDMSFVPRSHGNGTFTIFPKTEDPIISDGIINAVRESVNGVKSVGSIVYVEVPMYLAITLKIELRFNPGAQKNRLYGEVRLAIMDYINNLDEGGEIIINEIIQRVMDRDDKIADMAVTQFGFGEYNRNTGVVTGYTPLRLMNQVADWDQKWYTSSSFCFICEAGAR